MVGRSLTDEQEFIGITALLVVLFSVLYHIISTDIFLITAVVGVGAALVGLLPFFVTNAETTATRAASLALVVLLFVPLGYTALQLEWGVLSPVSLVLLGGLAFIFFYYSVFLPLAFYHVSRCEPEADAEAPYPTISVIVPAYNEEDCIGASIRALRETDYPAEKREIVIVDDGSTDGTYQEAQAASDESITILQKPNGGKYTALNHGLCHSTGDIVVTVDADSLLERDTLRTVAGTFQRDEDVGAIAGNLTVVNQNSLLTKVQELEYIVGIQLFRRAYDAVSTVIVVPGAFGAYRRETLEAIGGFTGETLTEDRDATVEILKSGSVTKASEALCHTEAPDTLRDLYKQRLRWYRGTVQTLLKHRDVFSRPSLGYTHSLAFPMEAFTVAIVPIVSIAVLISVAVELLTGSFIRVASLFAFFTLLQTLLSVLALRLGDDDLELAVYSPLFVLGYRQFLDGVMLKSVIDVFISPDLEWTSPDRTGELGAIQREEQGQSTQRRVEADGGRRIE
ncbi:glycosyltransferase [Halomarina rubra]|uniref:Glycosyltransferase n=1 Tax=Halomarina rubra TaxID=2071873 RepID=A0ABD6AT56_9EURY|nr:glycosyltransferase family 2 protein [Halomarina rubra]